MPTPSFRHIRCLLLHIGCSSTLVVGLMALSWLPARPVMAERPAPDPAAVEQEWRGTLAALSRRATLAGNERLATLIDAWEIAEPADRQLVFTIPPRQETPDWIEGDAQGLWDDFLAARRRHAETTFLRAQEAAREHDRPRSRDEENAALNAAPQPLSRQGAEAIRLLYRVLRDDPDHSRARAAGNWVKRNDVWVWPAVARRLDKGEEFDAAFGWLPRGRLARYREGERYESGRWLSAAEDDSRPRRIDRGWRTESDHWRIRSTATPAAAAALAVRLEESLVIWRQVFGAYAWEPAELEKRFEGRGRMPLRDPFAANLLASHDDYVNEVTKFEPAAHRSDAIYWTPTHTAWFAVTPDEDGSETTVQTRTILHEGAHQFFAEARTTSPLAGERCGFWAIEAAACYLESAVPAPFGWTVGGPDAGRVPAARERLMTDGFFIPLEELAGLGRKELQADERLPQIYSQIAGLSDFFINAQGGRYREAFVEYLERIYTGAASPDTLERLCRRSYDELDEEYHRHLAGGGKSRP
ncbi:MAG: hypothetical protein DWH79_04625 [Planctomycetota bacterium]|nr:MAG: hypothetical protein DWH79_04625 [Planctomycetota bacterium]